MQDVFFGSLIFICSDGPNSVHVAQCKYFNSTYCVHLILVVYVSFTLIISRTLVLSWWYSLTTDKKHIIHSMSKISFNENSTKHSTKCDIHRNRLIHLSLFQSMKLAYGMEGPVWKCCRVLEATAATVTTTSVKCLAIAVYHSDNYSPEYFNWRYSDFTDQLFTQSAIHFPGFSRSWKVYKKFKDFVRLSRRPENPETNNMELYQQSPILVRLSLQQLSWQTQTNKVETGAD